MKDTNVYYVGGSKGGVGKSLFSFALVDYLLERGQNVLLVDTDTDNPDVYKAHVSLDLPNLQCLMNSLDDADGWADLFDTVQEYPTMRWSSTRRRERKQVRQAMARS